MALLTINDREYIVEAGTLLSDAIGLHHTLELPCGGKGRCGKCRVTASGNLSPVSETERGHLSRRELEAGIRLACCTAVEGDCRVFLGEEAKSVICGGGEMPDFTLKPLFHTFGAAVDIGTTTLAARLYGHKGLLAQASGINPQNRYGADVISRIGGALAGKGVEMAQCIRKALKALLEELSGKAGISPEQIDALAITGNTAMLYLLTQTDPDCLSHAPFEASRLFGELWRGVDLELPCPTAKVYLPRCVSAFVGADLVTALLASGLWRKEETSVLADIGTNGEMALYSGKRLYCCHVIGGGKAAGVCGSGVVDAMSAFLELGLMDETGCLTKDPVFISERVSISQRDVRMVQLAKSAVCAGIQTLIENAGISMAEVGRLVIAGGFGSYLNLENAGKIGLIPPALARKASPIGNGALLGAAMVLLNQDFIELSSRLARQAETVDLAASSIFQERYLEGMLF